MNIAEAVSFLEAGGATLRLHGQEVLVWYPDEKCRQDLAKPVGALRARKGDVAAFLRTRDINAGMPPGVHLVHWNLKEPPVAIDTCSVVIDTALFARRTLEQLQTALAQPKRWVGWSVPQLIDRLAQVGVSVALESEEKLGETDQYKRNEKRVTDPYQELVRATLAKVSDQPVGIVPWLEQNRPTLYEELAVTLFDKIHRLWEGRAPLVEFERILNLWLETYRTGCEMYRGGCAGRREERE